MAYGTLNTGTITPGSGNTLTVNEAVTFTGAVTMQSANNQGFAAGTKMLFNQTAAPTGWTKVTSSNDVALRLTSGTVGTGGTVAFETAFASQTVPAHTLAVSEIPDHTHSIPAASALSAVNWGTMLMNNDNPARSYGETGSPGGGSHGHGSIDLNVSYVDVIIATKD
tara:strand:+ start:56 stop:556 length:501 start_codon:yes stop_codon:yes gene_type:complete